VHSRARARAEEEKGEGQEMERHPRDLVKSAIRPFRCHVSFSLVLPFSFFPFSLLPSALSTDGPLSGGYERRKQVDAVEK